MSETELQRLIMNTLQALGFWVVRTAVKGKRGKLGVRTGETGMPDLCIVSPSGWLEVKLPDGRLSDEQEAWHRRARNRGIKVATVRSVEEAVEIVRSWP